VVATTAKSLEQALTCDPRHAAAHYNLAKALSRNGDAERVLAHFRRAAALEPDSLQYQKGLGTCLLSVGLSQQALECFEGLSLRQPDDVQTHVNIASAYVQLRRNTDAMDAGQRALELARLQGNQTAVDRLEDWLKLVGGDPALPRDYRASASPQ
jgi:tetratricopeptide (TPR) repeat protein